MEDLELKIVPFSPPLAFAEMTSTHKQCFGLQEQVFVDRFYDTEKTRILI
jgi:hypothetical protein